MNTVLKFLFFACAGAGVAAIIVPVAVILMPRVDAETSPAQYDLTCAGIIVFENRRRIDWLNGSYHTGSHNSGDHMIYAPNRGDVCKVTYAKVN